MLTRFYVDNFQCLVNFEFKPERVNLLLGRNGSGKSTVFSALQAVGAVIQGGQVEAFLPVSTLPWWDSRRRQTFELELEDTGGEAESFRYQLVVEHAPGGAPTIVEEHLWQGSRSVVSYSDGNVRLPGVTERVPFRGRQSVMSLGLGRDEALSRFVQQVFGLLVFRLNPWSFALDSQDEAAVLHTSGSNLVAHLRGMALADPSAFVRWREQVLELMPHLDDVQLKQLIPGRRILVGVKLVDGKEVALSLANMSEGESCLLALHAIAAATSNSRIIALDEPDNFLALSEVQPVLRRFTMQQNGEPGPQVFIITHHPQAIDYLAAYATWLMEKGADGLARIRRYEFNRDDGERAAEALLYDLSP